MGNLLAAFMAVGLAGSAFAQNGDAKAYATELAKWRQSQEDELRADGGFLSVAGLFWLKEGDNSLGAGESCAVRLPAGTTAAKVGIVTRQGDPVSYVIDGGTPVALALDSGTAKIGTTTLMAIKRGSRIGIRMWDKTCKEYREFKGQKWYGPNRKYIVQAKFVPYGKGKTVDITNVIGDTQPVPLAGYVEFVLNGKTCRLDAQGQGGGLFINFRDLTSGKMTYPAGRFLDAPKPVDGMVTLDFNRATNPPCAFTAFATCPLPPRQNYLEVSIPAGEKTHHPVE